jgi:hypothetical protein
MPTLEPGGARQAAVAEAVKLAASESKRWQSRS